MNSTTRDIAAIIGEAVELPSAAERVAFLDHVCGDDSSFRQRV